jgi:hypothetical protein
MSCRRTKWEGKGRTGKTRRRLGRGSDGYTGVKPVDVADLITRIASTGDIGYILNRFDKHFQLGSHFTTILDCGRRVYWLNNDLSFQPRLE